MLHWAVAWGLVLASSKGVNGRALCMGALCMGVLLGMREGGLVCSMTSLCEGAV